MLGRWPGRDQVRLARLDDTLGAVLPRDAHFTRLEVAEVGGGAPVGATGKMGAHRGLPVEASFQDDAGRLATVGQLVDVDLGLMTLGPMHLSGFVSLVIGSATNRVIDSVLFSSTRKNGENLGLS